MVNQKFGLAPVQFTATEKNVILAADRAANLTFARRFGSGAAGVKRFIQGSRP